MRKKKTLLIAGLLAVVVIAAAVGIFFMQKVDHYKKAIAEITYSGIDITAVPDGTYTGECDVGLIYAKTEVAVKDGIITKITLLEHRNGRGGTAEGIENTIVERQQIDVDTVSGATNSSNVIKKAVDNALNQK